MDSYFSLPAGGLLQCAAVTMMEAPIITPVHWCINLSSVFLKYPSNDNHISIWNSSISITLDILHFGSDCLPIDTVQGAMDALVPPTVRVDMKSWITFPQVSSKLSLLVTTISVIDKTKAFHSHQIHIFSRLMTILYFTFSMMK